MVGHGYAEITGLDSVMQASAGSILTNFVSFVDNYNLFYSP